MGESETGEGAENIENLKDETLKPELRLLRAEVSYRINMRVCPAIADASKWTFITM
jgi:hypothetical protein